MPKATYISLLSKVTGLNSFLLETCGALVRALAKLRKTTPTLGETAIILCFIALNSGCECKSKAISYKSLVNFGIG